MWRVKHGLLLTLLLAAPLASIPAQETSDDDIGKLDDQVQELKTEVLEIAAELDSLERRLLYPSGTRLLVSLAMDPKAGVRPDAVEIRIDGDLVAHHIYTARELDALRKGGIHTVYTGNTTAGTHEMVVNVIGKLAPDADVARTIRYVFTKGIDAKELDIILHPAGPGDDGIRIEDR